MKLLGIVLTMILLPGCATVKPVTWQERIEKKTETMVNLHYVEQGSGEVLLLLHGFAQSSFTWRDIVDDLAKQYRVISLDLKGFGESPKPKDGRYSAYDQAVAVKHFIEQHGLQRITVVGHSLGGGVALALALMAESEPWQVDRLVVIDGAAYNQKLPSMIRDLNRPVIGNIGVYLVPPEYQARKAYQFSFFDAKKIPVEGINESIKNFSKPGSRYVLLQSAKQLVPDDIEKISIRYQTIKQPTLIIWGFNDGVVPRRFAKKLHSDLKNSQLKFIDRTGHMPQEEAPKSVLKLIQAFLKVDNA